MKIIEHTFLFFNTIEYNTIIRGRIKLAIKNKPQAIFLGTYYQFLNLTKVLKEFGYEGKLYSIEIDEYLANESKNFFRIAVY